MKNLSVAQRKIIADYFSNIGVAWFVVGVINVFFAELNSLSGVIYSFSWGILFSTIFLRAALVFTKGIK